MTKAIFAGEKIKELTLNPVMTVFTPPNAILPKFFKDIFVCNGPGYTGDDKCQQKKIDQLNSKRGHRRPL
jgi:hypothetical protein